MGLVTFSLSQKEENHKEPWCVVVGFGLLVGLVFSLESVSKKSAQMMHIDIKYKYSPSIEECKAIFIASCVESAARECGMPADAMYERMSRIHLIEEYILPCYDVLHSESRKNVTADILKTMELWEKKANIN